MLSFYRSSRVRGCDLESDGDMLLFQWGTHDWGHGEHFEIDITRQLAWDDRGWLQRALRREADPEIWQLSLTYGFEPADGLSAFGSGNRWCHSPAELTDFEDFIRDAAPFKSTAERIDGTIQLDFGSVE